VIAAARWVELGRLGGAASSFGVTVCVPSTPVCRREDEAGMSPLGTTGWRPLLSPWAPSCGVATTTMPPWARRRVCSPPGVELFDARSG
jgi:hypothetical protein